MRMFHKVAAAAALLGVLSGPALAQTSNIGVTGGVNTLGSGTQAFIQAGIQSFVKTYKYSSIGNVPAAAHTDLLTLTGSATKTIRLMKIVVGGENSAGASQRGVQIIRRSTADTGGTSTVPVGLARDTANSAASGALALYTVAPTGLGTAVGTLDSCRLLLNAAGTVPDSCSFTYGVNNDQPVVLRGVLDSIAINFLTTGQGIISAATTDFIDLDIEWTEE
jgi:hypothetical protein